MTLLERGATRNEDGCGGKEENWVGSRGRSGRAGMVLWGIVLRTEDGRKHGEGGVGFQPVSLTSSELRFPLVLPVRGSPRLVASCSSPKTSRILLRRARSASTLMTRGDSEWTRSTASDRTQSGRGHQ
eukprot:1696438-Rhodomonas_salina.3